ncbi:MAG TPA: S24 family peptidase [Streptosporangiaceae bacterium]|nr:S24 family peptidase [Streptosporangiaceae bacterium]
MTMTDYAMQARPASRSGTPRPKGRPGRKPKGSGPVVVPEAADKPDPGHVLTWRQRKILRAIRESVQKRGYPPSMLEIGAAVGLTSTSSVSYQLRILQRKGYLHRDVGRARTMELRMPGRAGIPGIDIPSQQAEGTLFLLKVVGDSMINAAIADGDWVVVRQQDAQDGDIVAATAYTPILGDEASILGRVVAVLRRV